MYFYRKGGKQILDLKGDLFITHNTDPVKTRGKSIAPAAIKNTKYIKLHNVGFFRKVFIMFYVAAYVWRSSEELTEDKTNLKKPYVKNSNDYAAESKVIEAEGKVDDEISKMQKFDDPESFLLKKYKTGSNPNNCQCFDKQGKPLNDCDNCPR